MSKHFALIPAGVEGLGNLQQPFQAVGQMSEIGGKYWCLLLMPSWLLSSQ